jgi:hypothetical protein
MLLIETGLVLVALLIAALLPSLASRLFLPLERELANLARRKRLAVVVVGLSALAVRLALLPVLPVPSPVVHDEFSHLLLTDTLAHGRLANPVHPMWVHFETFHINQKPTYASMYYPGPAIFMAAGQVIFGHPFWGVWLGGGVMCAAICWALQGWLPPFWALLGGFLALIRLATFSYWANSYRGGAVAAIGGALVLGALPRIKRHRRLQDSLLMGLGLTILVISRPYEGLFFTIPVAFALFAWMLGQKSATLRASIRRIAVPIALIMALTAVGLGYYFWRTTGSPFRMGYQVNNATYGVSYFLWDKPRPDMQYHHATMRNYYVGEVLAQHEVARAHPLLALFLKVAPLWLFYLGPVLTLPIVILAGVLPSRFSWKQVSRKTRCLLLVCATTIAALALLSCMTPAHYVAAATIAIYGLVLQSMRRLRLWHRRTRQTGICLVRAVFVICILLLFVRAGAAAGEHRISEPFLSWCWPDSPLVGRAPVIAQLNAYPGRHLVIVRYNPDHHVQMEWVYNAADIDDSKIVWARDMGPTDNAELIHYFKDRTLWLLQPDESLELKSYADQPKPQHLFSATQQDCAAPQVSGSDLCRPR